MYEKCYVIKLLKKMACHGGKCPSEQIILPDILLRSKLSPDGVSGTSCISCKLQFKLVRSHGV